MDRRGAELAPRLVRVDLIVQLCCVSDLGSRHASGYIPVKKDWADTDVKPITASTNRDRKPNMVTMWRTLNESDVNVVWVAINDWLEEYRLQQYIPGSWSWYPYTVCRDNAIFGLLPNNVQANINVWVWKYGSLIVILAKVRFPGTLCISILHWVTEQPKTIWEYNHSWGRYSMSRIEQIIYKTQKWFVYHKEVLERKLSHIIACHSVGLFEYFGWVQTQIWLDFWKPW